MERQTENGTPEAGGKRGGKSLGHFHEANAFALKYFQDELRDETRGREARAYLKGRGIGKEAVERFGMGFAPDEWRSLRDAAAKHGLEEATLLEVGLLIQREEGKEPYDHFRNRIIFPIESTSGKVLAFGGRTLGESGKGGPKYLNSPESPVYHKGKVLYGLSWAKDAIRREKGALVVEGYMDAVSLAAGGIENVVAPLGNSMTEDQASLLSRYCSRVFILFDSDVGGQRGTFRAGDILLAAGLHPAVVTLPPGEDPDTIIQKEGPEGIREYLNQAVDVLDRKLQILEENDRFSSVEGIRDAVDRLLPTLRAAKDPALRDIYVSKVAEKTGVRRETLEGEMEKKGAPSTHLTREIEAVFRRGRPLDPSESVPRCWCPDCTGIPDVNPTRARPKEDLCESWNRRVARARGVPILDVARGGGLELRKEGQRYRASCPFHEDRTPSFVITPEKGKWHCFGCGRGGDGIALVQRLRNLSFPDAVRELAR